MTLFSLSFVFFLSGAAGLVFELVWFYRCGIAFGNTVWAASLVLSSFMAGLGLGNIFAARFAARIRRPLRAYAVLESFVAVSGVLSTLALPLAGTAVAALTRSLGDNAAAANVLRAMAAFVVLCIPATAMGATLPMVVGAATRGHSRFAAALGRLYGWNTIGAVAGVLLAETVLIPGLGVFGAAVFAAALDLAAAGLAVSAVRERAEAAFHRSSEAAPSAEWRRLSVAIACAAAVAGATLVGLEVVWFRFLSMYVLTTTIAMSVMLAVVLAAIGLGGLAVSNRGVQPADYPRAVGLAAIAAALGVVASYVLFDRLTSGTQIGSVARVAWLAFVLTFPTSFFSGALFPLMGGALREWVGASGTAQDIRSTAWLAWANTGGAACGPLLAGFALLPAWGMEGALFAAVAAYGAIAAVAFSTGDGRALRSYSILGAGAAFAVALALFPFGLMRNVFFIRAAAAYAGDGSTIVATREGPSETIFLMQQRWLAQPVYSRLVTNGFSMSGTSIGAQRYMRYFVYWPMFVHRGPLRRALIICYGVGVTVAAADEIPSLESIDVVELSKDIVSMSDVIYPPAGNPLHDARVRLHVEDGRAFLQRTDRRFDLITGEPPPPRTPGAPAIYTREYFKLLRDRLNDGGVATYWLPIGRPNPGTDVSSIIRAFCDVFDDCSLWNATPFDLMLAGLNGIGPAPSISDVARPWDDKRLGMSLREVGFEIPQQIGATFIGDAAFARALTAGAPPLVDDFPQRLRPVPGRPSLSDPGYGVDPAATRLYQTVIDPERARQAFAESPLVRQLFPASLIAQTLPLFAEQRLINAVLWEGAQPLRHIDDLDAVLTKTRLRTLPLWMLGSDAVKQRIAALASPRDGAAIYARALDALVGRDYVSASVAFLQAQAAGLPSSPTVPLAAYAACAGGDRREALRIARGVTARDPGEGGFWSWFAAHCAG